MIDMGILTSIKKFFCDFLKCNSLSYPVFNVIGKYDINEVLTLLKSEFPNASILLSDLEYEKISKEDLIKFLRSDDTDLYQYKPEIFDCDDFSYRLMGQLSIPGYSGIPFGIVWTKTPRGGHALNCFIDENCNVWLVEPQSDKVFKLPKDWDVYIVMM